MSNPQNPAYSIVVPVFNSTASLEELLTRLDKVLQAFNAAFELILVDDGSPDPDTWPAVQQLAHKDSRVRAFRLTRNFGKPAAVLCGLRQARGKYVVTMDDDLQHAPEDLPALIEASDHDVVIGKYAKRRHGLVKRLSSFFKAFFDRWLIGKPKGIYNSPFKLIQRPVVDAMLTVRSPYPFIPALLFYVTRDVVNVEVSHEPRKYGKSAFGIKKRLKAFGNLLINNSSLLLNIIAGVGICFALVSFALGIYFVIKKLTVGIPVPGWASIITLTAFTNGLILFAVGVVGEYLIRIINGVEKRPPYIVREKTDADE